MASNFRIGAVCMLVVMVVFTLWVLFGVGHGSSGDILQRRFGVSKEPNIRYPSPAVLNTTGL